MKINAAELLNKPNRILYVSCNEEYFSKMFDIAKKTLKINGIVYHTASFSRNLAGDIKEYSYFELKDMKDAAIFICDPNVDRVRQNAAGFAQDNFLYDHIENYGSRINVRLLIAMGCEDYVSYTNNEIIAGDISGKGNVTVVCYSKDNKVTIGKVSVINRLLIGLFGNNSDVKLDDRSSFFDVIINVTTNANVSVGKDCMFSHDVTISATDQHLIFDLASKKRINKAKHIEIGNHVWVGRNAALLAGVCVPDNCVVGSSAVTSRKFEKTSCIIAGNPAKVIREQIIWSRDSQSCDYDVYDKCSEKKAVDYFTEEEKALYGSVQE